MLSDLFTKLLRCLGFTASPEVGRVSMNARRLSAIIEAERHQ